MFSRISALIFLLFFFINSCSAVTNIGLRSASSDFPHILDGLMKQKNVRFVKEGLPGQILLLSALVELSPSDHNLLTYAAMSYVTYGLMVEDEDPVYAGDLYLTAKEYGFRALRTNSRFREEIEKGNSVKVSIKHLGKDYTSALYWTGLSLGLEVMQTGGDISNTMQTIDTVNAMMHRVLVLDEKFFFGTPHLYLALHYALLPDSLGGGIEKADAEFKKAFAINEGKFLLADVLYARYYATIIQDEDLFLTHLNKVLDTPSDVIPQVLINEIAKEKARKLLKKKYEFFDKQLNSDNEQR
ncbi:MAG: hypothetical protein JSU92_08495 [Deltaproteobacteria bacterium]|nr:MAG: hypothetical protein JSU92_08495 [Deltaproteobacteria bacterium]